MPKGKKHTSHNFFERHRNGLKLFVLIIAAGGMFLKGALQIPRINNGREQIARLTKQIEYEKQRQSEIETLKDKVSTDEYIEKIASEKLGLVKSNSKIFIDVSGE